MNAELRAARCLMGKPEGVHVRRYLPGDLKGVRLQDEAITGPRDMVTYLDNAVRAEAMCDGERVLGAGGFIRITSDCWHFAFGMVEGVPRGVWKYALIRAPQMIAHAVRHAGVKRIETHVVATFDEGHGLVDRMGFEFCGLEWGGEHGGKLLAKYVTGGPCPLPTLNPMVANHLRLTWLMTLGAYAPKAHARLVRKHLRAVPHG